MQNTPHPKAIVFDGHGTLTYPKRSTLLFYHQLAKKNGVVISKDELRTTYIRIKRKHIAFLQKKAASGEPVVWEEDRREWFTQERVLFERLGCTDDFDALSYQVLDAYMDPKNQRVYSDVLPLVQWLRKNNYIVGVLTNSDSRYRSILDYHGLLPYCSPVVISSEVGYKKPSCEVFAALERSCGVPLTSIWYVGDQYKLDVLASLEAGVAQSLWISRHGKHRGQVVQRGCRVVRSLRGVQRLLYRTHSKNCTSTQ